MENTLEDLVSTIERNCKDNKAEITNVKLWADSWREEFRDKINELLGECDLEEYDAEMRLGSIKIQLNYWLKEMDGVQDPNQTVLKLKRA